MKITKHLVMVLISVGVISLSAQANAATELIQNGGFESGDLTAWSTSNLGEGDWFVTDSYSTPLTYTLTTGASSGDFYAVTDQYSAGVNALSQGFNVPFGSTQLTLSFDLFVNSAASAVVGAQGLDFQGDPNQLARVDLLTSSASAFDTGSGVLQSFYANVDAPGTNGYTHYTFDITPYVTNGSAYQLRFSDVNNQGYLNVGVDNVSIAAVPESSTLAMMLAGLGVMSFVVARRSNI